MGRRRRGKERHIHINTVAQGLTREEMPEEFCVLRGKFFGLRYKILSKIYISHSGYMKMKKKKKVIDMKLVKIWVV